MLLSFSPLKIVAEEKNARLRRHVNVQKTSEKLIVGEGGRLLLFTSTPLLALPIFNDVVTSYILPPLLFSSCTQRFTHRLSMELDFQSLFGLHVHSCT
jgi:hypothetical protein